MRLFVIPTHRKCDEAIKSINQEIEVFLNEKKEEAMFVLLDNGEKDVYEKNDRFLRNYPMVCQKYHVGIEKMKEVVMLISKEININLYSILFPNDINYGKIYNFIYILAIAFNVSGVHRRDSDCQLHTLKIDEAPIVHEIKFLNANVEKMKSQLAIEENIDYSDCEKILMVGGGYLGNWDIDMSDIVESNPNALKYLMKICNIKDAAIEDSYNKKYGESKKVYEKAILSSVFSTDHALECGNVSMSEVYKYIPNFIGRNGVGFDYHTNFVAFECKVPMVYHTNKIYHIHDQSRHIDIKPINYWEGIIKMVDFDNFHYKLIENEEFKSLRNEKYGMDVIKNIYKNILPDKLHEYFQKLDCKNRMAIINEIIYKILIESKIPFYIKIGRLLENREKIIIEELNKEYLDSIYLQRRWADIVELLQNINISKYIKPLHSDI